MRCLKMIAVILVPLMLSLTGCGSDSSGTTSANNPFTTSGGNTSGGGSEDPIFSNISSSRPAFTLRLGTNVPTVDANNGTLLAQATLVASRSGVIIGSDGNPSTVSSGTPIPNAPVTFSILAGPATIDPGPISTDSVGLAVARITTGNTLTTTNVLVQASTTINGQPVTSVTSFQIVRGTGVIMFSSDAGLTPGSQTNILPLASKEVDPAISQAWTFMQLTPFKVTDSNGNPRVGVPVTLSVYSITTLNPNDVTIDFLVPPITESNQTTITTDSAGQGVFNVAVTLLTPLPGGVNTVDVVFKAVTNDSIPVTAYLGAPYTLSAKLPTLTISPAAASFGTATDLTFNISGGISPFTVTSSNPGFATATLQADGHTVIVHLVDAAAATGTAIISVTDSAGQSTSATVSR